MRWIPRCGTRTQLALWLSVFTGCWCRSGGIKGCPGAEESNSGSRSNYHSPGTTGSQIAPDLPESDIPDAAALLVGRRPRSHCARAKAREASCLRQVTARGGRQACSPSAQRRRMIHHGAIAASGPGAAGGWMDWLWLTSARAQGSTFRDSQIRANSSCGRFLGEKATFPGSRITCKPCSPQDLSAGNVTVCFPDPDASFPTGAAAPATGRDRRSCRRGPASVQ